MVAGSVTYRLLRLMRGVLVASRESSTQKVCAVMRVWTDAVYVEEGEQHVQQDS